MTNQIIYWDPREFRSVQNALSERPEQAGRALVRAVNKTLAWVRSQINHRVSRAHGIPLKSLKRRIHISKATSRKKSGHAWMGIKPIAAIYAVRSIPADLVKANRSRSGVKAGTNFFPGAFIYPVYGVLNVFKRKGKSRMPVIRQDIELTEVPGIFNSIGAQVGTRFETVFAQEFNYEVNVRGKA